MFFYRVYYSESEIIALLKLPFFSNPITENIISYELYRNHNNVTVYTIRYNMLSTFSEENMIQDVIQKVLKQFSTKKQIVGMTDYDLLLVADNSDPKSLYVWRANSNQRQNLNTNETVLELTYDSLFLYVRNAAKIHVPSLNVNYVTSKVTVDRILAIVFTFVNV